MDINELKVEIRTKTQEFDTKLEAKDVDGAKALKEEIRQAQDLLKMAEEREADEKRDLIAQREKNKEEERGNKSMEQNVNEMRSLVKKVMGKELTTEERAVIKETDNAPLFPKQFINELEKIKLGYGALKQYCHVIPVNRMEGTKPVIDMNQNKLSEIGEGVDIVQGGLVSKDISFKCTKVGLMDILSSESVDDAVVDIEGLAKENFAEIATINENTKILKIIKDNATDSKKNTGYKDIVNQMDAFAPAIKDGLVTVTNSDGFALLKNMEDGNKRPLNLVTEMGGKYIFNGKELVVVDPALLTAKDATKNIFITCNMKESIKFFDRKAVTIEKWRKPENDTQNISILERFDVKVGGTTRSIVKFEF